MKINWQSIKTHLTSLRTYVHAATSAAVSAALTAVASMAVTPDLTMKQIAHTACVGAVIGTAGYFVKSPVSK